jgi:hypothetical protein
MELFILALGVAAIMLASMAFIVSVATYVKVTAMEKSTHSIQYVPVDPTIDKENQEFMNKWATSDEAIKKDTKLFKEELEDNMPEFSLDEDDKKIFSL